ncbi:DDE_3 domain-containing protein [Trichonephila clavipes]|nr:DDE_3 domain-containing protein [Trichonephila clavipes]
MAVHIYRDVILEQHARLFRSAMVAEFLFMDDNARPHPVNIVDACLKSQDITRMDWPAYSSDLYPIEHVRTNMTNEDRIGWMENDGTIISHHSASRIRGFDELPLMSRKYNGRGSLAIKVTDSWPTSHEFDPGSTKVPPCRKGRFKLNMLRLNIRRWCDRENRRRSVSSQVSSMS